MDMTAAGPRTAGVAALCWRVRKVVSTEPTSPLAKSRPNEANSVSRAIAQEVTPLFAH